MYERPFAKILHANDGSEQAFQALALALAVARQSCGELHIVSVGEIDYVPQSVGDIKEQKAAAEGRLHTVLQRARALAARENLELHGHVMVGHPVRDIVALARQLNVDLLVIGAKGHSPLYERLIGSRASQIMQLAHCPVLAVKSSRRGPKVRDRFRLPAAWTQIVGAAARGTSFLNTWHDQFFYQRKG
jgi:nucleotide-binding universal stress UspA family protein